MFVAVENENDNTPLTDLPVYYASIPENSGSGKVVLELTATDLDADPNKKIFYKITAGNPESYFTIDSESGEENKFHISRKNDFQKKILFII